MAVIPKGSVFLLTQGTFELVFAVCRARIDLDVDVLKMEFTADDAEVDWSNENELGSIEAHYEFLVIHAQIVALAQKG